MWVNPSEKQQEVDQQERQGRGKEERKERGGSKRAASSGLPGQAPIRKHGGKGQREMKERGEKGGPCGNRGVLRLTRRSRSSHHEDGRQSLKSRVQPPRRGAAIGANLSSSHIYRRHQSSGNCGIIMLRVILQ